MDNLIKFPSDLEKLIAEIFHNEEIKLQEVEQLIRVNSVLNKNERKYLFNTQGSRFKIMFTITELPKSSCYLAFIKNDNDYFDFESYLASIKSSEHKAIHKDLYLSGDKNLENQYIIEYLKLIKKYFFTTLKRVAKGEEWIKVPLDWGPNK